jgi:hypothetical protein
MRYATPIELLDEDQSFYLDYRDGEYKQLQTGEFLIDNYGDGVWVPKCLDADNNIDEGYICFSLKDAKEYIREQGGKHVRWYNRNY